MSDVANADEGLNVEEIREVIENDIAGTQHWRREKGFEYPDDDRNSDAEQRHGKILATLGTVSPDLLRRFNRAWTHGERDGIYASEAWGQILREVGFRNDFEDATDLIEAFLDRLS